MRARKPKVVKENGERWLLTYADLITLLMIFFILLYAMSTTNTRKFQDLTGALRQAFNNGQKLVSAGGTFFGSPNNPRIVRLFSQSVEIPITGTLLLLNNLDKPGIVGHLGTLLGRHNINIASMSLSRDVVGGLALTALSLDSVPPAAMLEELQKDHDISNVKVVSL